MNTLATTTVTSAKQGASVAAELFDSDLQIDTKGSKLDYVTNADTESQSTVVAAIEDEFPDEIIIHEENNENTNIPESGDCWVVDPIDGTSNFVVGNPFWATSVAVIKNHVTRAAATVAPSLSDIYIAHNDGAFRNGEQITVSDREQLQEFTVGTVLRYGTEMDDQFSELLKNSLLAFGDLRRLGSAQLTFAMVAHGGLDACLAIQPDANPWDTVAGVELVRKAGGEVTDIFGNPWSPDSHGIIATNGNAHNQMVVKIHEMFPEYATETS